MWKRDEAPRPMTTGTPSGALPETDMSTGVTKPSVDVRRPLEGGAVSLGKSIVVKGELNGSEDLVIEGQVEGKIEFKQHVLTVGPNGKVKAQIFAKTVIVLGEVVGNITASEKVDIRDNGSVDGDIVSPRVAIAEGAHFRGSIDMQRTPVAARPADGRLETKPAAMPAAPPASRQ